MKLNSTCTGGLQERAKLLAQKIFVQKMNPDASKPQGRVSFLLAANKLFEGGKRLIRPGIQGAGYNCFAKLSRFGKSFKKSQITFKLLLLGRKGGPAIKK